MRIVICSCYIATRIPVSATNTYLLIIIASSQSDIEMQVSSDTKNQIAVGQKHRTMYQIKTRSECKYHTIPQIKVRYECKYRSIHSIRSRFVQPSKPYEEKKRPRQLTKTTIKILGPRHGEVGVVRGLRRELGVVGGCEIKWIFCK